MSNNTDRLKELGRIVADRVPILIEEARDNLLQSIDALVEDAQEQDKEATLRLSITVTWPLNGSAVNVAMPVSVRRKYEATASLGDPAQPGLFDRDGDEVGEGVNNAVRKIAEAVRAKGRSLSISMGEAVELREAVNNEIQRRALEGGVA